MSDEQLDRAEETDDAVEAHQMGQPMDAPREAFESPREAMEEPPDVEGHLFEAPREAPRE